MLYARQHFTSLPPTEELLLILNRPGRKQLCFLGSSKNHELSVSICPQRLQFMLTSLKLRDRQGGEGVKMGAAAVIIILATVEK